MNGPLQVEGERPLRFFPGQAIGPVNKLFEYDSESFAKAIQVELEDGSRIYTYLNGGCYFEPNEEAKSQFKQIACYSTGNDGPEDALMPVDRRLAIVGLNIGQGKFLLSGVHFEFNASDLDHETNENIRTNVYLKLINQEATTHSNEQLVRSLMRQIFDF
jgi:biotin--protein ligase